MLSFLKPLVVELAKTRQFKSLVLTMCEQIAKRTDNNLDDYAVNHLRVLMFPEQLDAE